MEKITLVQGKAHWEAHCEGYRSVEGKTADEALGKIILAMEMPVTVTYEFIRFCWRCGEHRPCECPPFDLSYLEPVWHPE